MALQRVWVVAAIGLVACGGSFSAEHSNAGSPGVGGTSATGGSASGGHATGGTSSGGAGGGMCPPELPDGGGGCTSEGLNCRYSSGCCPVYATCSAGQWSVTYTDCAPPGCPLDGAPVGGTDCTCQEGLGCLYGSCASGSTEETRAECTSTSTGTTPTWQVTVAACPIGPLVCGTLTCGVGQICVTTEVNISNQYACVLDPCAPDPLDCSCAAQLCNVACQVQGSQNLLCYCPTCG